MLVKKAEAYQIGETRKREAEAAVLEVQNRAMAKAALAEAERVEAEQRAALEAPAKAEKARIVVDAEAEAEKRRIEAKAKPARSSSSSKPRPAAKYEILAKKGEGLKRIVEACGGAKQAFQMLMLEHLDNLAEASGQGDLEHQVRQGRGLGKRRAERPQQHGQLPAEHGPDAAADDAGDEGHRRRRAARVAGEVRRRRRPDRQGCTDEDLPDDVVVRNGAGTAAQK